jgi:hypothetical protein
MEHTVILPLELKKEGDETDAPFSGTNGLQAQVKM